MDTTYHKGFKGNSMTIVLDSSYRNMDDYPSVEDFTYGHAITSSWPMHKGEKTDKKHYSLKLVNVVIPYRANLLTGRYYMASISHTNDKMHRRLLNGSSSPGYNRSNFILCVEKVVGTSWIYLRSMTGSIQTTVLLGGGEFSFKIYDSTGKTLTINSTEDATKPENQVSAIFELSPL